MSRRRRSRERLETAAVAALVLGASAASCTYDFDQFVHDTGGASSAGHDSGAAAHGGLGAAGRAAAAGTGGTGENGGASDAGESGSSGSSTSGGSGGKAAAGSAGSPSSGGAGAGGKTSGTAGKSGSAGKTNSAGQGGTPAAAGGSGAPASAGAAGKTTTSCSGTTYGGHCYFLLGTDSDWPSAKSTCEAYSSKTHLVTITSSEEQAAIVKAFFPTQTDTWIGLALADPSKSPDSTCKLLPDQCPFKWVTGEALDYTDWTRRSSTDSEPDYTGSCVRLQAAGETWADTSCTSSKYPAICEED